MFAGVSSSYVNEKFALKRPFVEAGFVVLIDGAVCPATTVALAQS